MRSSKSQSAENAELCATIWGLAQMLRYHDVKTRILKSVNSRRDRKMGLVSQGIGLQRWTNGDVWQEWSANGAISAVLARDLGAGGGDPGERCFTLTNRDWRTMAARLWRSNGDPSYILHSSPRQRAFENNDRLAVVRGLLEFPVAALFSYANGGGVFGSDDADSFVRSEVCVPPGDRSVHSFGTIALAVRLGI